MFYDLIIVARSEGSLIQMTQDCIDSCGADRVILVETGQKTDYRGVDVYLSYYGAFNYNHCLNLGLEYAKGDVHVLANNDLIFHDWKTIGDDMINNGFGSASAWFKGCGFPQGDFIYEGYDIAIHLTGWCLFVTSETIKKIGKLNEGVDFWYSDNVYAEQLKKEGIRHGLFCNARVDHLESKTLNTMSVKIKRQYSIGQLSKYKLCQTKRK